MYIYIMIGMENIVISTPGDASVATDSIPFGTSSATLSAADAIMMVRSHIYKYLSICVYMNLLIYVYQLPL
jgi:hypothetical protein